jgi:hypothetical protein
MSIVRGSLYTILLISSLLVSNLLLSSEMNEIAFGERFEKFDNKKDSVLENEKVKGIIESLELRDQLILPLGDYDDQDVVPPRKRLLHRVEQHPFNLAATAIFILAILHAFFAHYFKAWSQKITREHQEKHGKDAPHKFSAEILHFFGEIEVIFGLWVIPLVISIAYYFNWDIAYAFLKTCDYVEPIFVVAIMILSSTRPITCFADRLLKQFASLGKESAGAWWLTILIVGPILGSLITEPAAMTICALLLIRHFYLYTSDRTFKYATMGLLFVNISVGGVLTHFAAPPVLMVARPWGWGTEFMFTHFGWKAVIGILINTSLYYFWFRKELRLVQANMNASKDSLVVKGGKVPWWIISVHLVFLFLIVLNAHYPVVVVGLVLVFLAFYQATSYYQDHLSLKPSVLVGCFLAGLIIHGSFQGWWISVILEFVESYVLMAFAVVLTSFNDNAAITYLSTVIPNVPESAKYFIVAGAVTGGGLTVIANAPNPAGQHILKEYFPEGISPMKLLLAAIIPTIIVGVCFVLLPNIKLT